jgi:uncharacterized membrane protein
MMILGAFLLLLGLIIAAAIGVTALVHFVPDHPVWRRLTVSADPALAELRLRYARGEISQEEFLIRAFDLGGTPTPGHIPVR